MKLNSLLQTVRRSKKRLGQGHGSGRVKTSGRGTKGQNARSKRPLQFEGGAVPLTKRLPFLPGKDRNKSLQLKPAIINLSDLEKLPPKTKITLESLIKYRLVSLDSKHKGVKLLGNGNVDKAYDVEIPVSARALEKIKKAGGNISQA